MFTCSTHLCSPVPFTCVHLFHSHVFTCSTHLCSLVPHTCVRLFHSPVFTCSHLQCSTTCEKGVSMRAVKCRVGTSLLQDTACDASKRPQDRQSCDLGTCPTPPPVTTTTTTTTAPQAAFWRFGSWTEVGQGERQGDGGGGGGWGVGWG